MDYITKALCDWSITAEIKAMFAMLEHHKPAKDIYDDGRLFLDFSEQAASVNGKPLTLSPMEYKMLNLFRKNPASARPWQLLEKLWDIDEKFVDEHTLTTSISRDSQQDRSRRWHALHQDRLRHGLSVDGRRGEMKFKNLSVKRLFGRVAMGLVLSMSGITIALFL